MKALLSLALLSTLLLSQAAAQSDSPEAAPASSVAAKPQPAARPLQAGVFGGAGFSFSSGTYTSACNCGYTGGSGLAPMGGLFLEYPVSQRFAVEVRAGYGASYTKYTLTDNRSVFSGVGEGVSLQFERMARVTVQSVQASVLGVWNPGGSDLYLQAGAAVGIPGANTLKETEQILTSGWVYPDTKTNVASISDGKLSDAHQVRGVALGVQVGVGWDFPLTDRIGIAPEIGYVFPLTSVLEDETSWKLNTVQGLIRARWTF